MDTNKPVYKMTLNEYLESIGFNELVQEAWREHIKVYPLRGRTGNYKNIGELRDTMMHEAIAGHKYMIKQAIECGDLTYDEYVKINFEQYGDL